LKVLQSLTVENSYSIAKFYDKQKNYKAAYVYYNEVVQRQPDSPDAQRAKQRMDEIRAKVGENGLKIGGTATATAQASPPDGRKLQAQADTAARPDFVGPPPPTPTPSPVPSATPDQSIPAQKPMRTAPGDVTPAPVEPALPAQ